MVSHVQVTGQPGFEHRVALILWLWLQFPIVCPLGKPPSLNYICAFSGASLMAQQV